jgi:hypothetical protein
MLSINKGGKTSLIGLYLVMAIFGVIGKVAGIYYLIRSFLHFIESIMFLKIGV